MARPYRLGKRLVGVQATRRRILDATRQLLEQGGVDTANIQQIAKLAGVTRPTVYQQFGSRQELLLQVMNEGLDSADVRHVRKALQHPDAGKAVRGMIRKSCQFWESGHPLFHRVKGLALIDDAASAVDAEKEAVRRGHIENLTGRLANQGLLKKGVTRRHADDVLYLLTSFEVFDQLRSRGYSADKIGSRLVQMAEQTVLA